MNQVDNVGGAILPRVGYGAAVSVGQYKSYAIASPTGDDCECK